MNIFKQIWTYLTIWTNLFQRPKKIDKSKAYLWKLDTRDQDKIDKFMKILKFFRPNSHDLIADGSVNFIVAKEAHSTMSCHGVSSKTALLRKINQAIGEDFKYLETIYATEGVIRVVKVVPLEEKPK